MTDMTKHDRETISKISGRVVFAAAVLACLIVMGTGSASAAVTPVFRTVTHYSYGACCVLFNATVSINETENIRPAVVVWNTGYTISTPDVYNVGLSVNSGPCQIGLFGPAVLPDVSLVIGSDLDVNIECVILPSDEVLVPGTNTFQVCGGNQTSSASFETLINTLSVTLD